MKAGGVDGSNCATASHEAALIVGNLHDITISFINNSLKDLHVVQKEANRTVTGAAKHSVRHQSLDFHKSAVTSSDPAPWPHLQQSRFNFLHDYFLNETVKRGRILKTSSWRTFLKVALSLH